MLEKDKVEKTSLLMFPCLFPIKVMGEKSATLQAEIVQVVCTHSPNFTEEDMLTVRQSKQGNYLSFTLTVPVVSQAQLDALYQALTAHANVKWVL